MNQAELLNPEQKQFLTQTCTLIFQDAMKCHESYGVVAPMIFGMNLDPKKENAAIHVANGEQAQLFVRNPKGAISQLKEQGIPMADFFLVLTEAYMAVGSVDEPVSLAGSVSQMPGRKEVAMLIMFDHNGIPLGMASREIDPKTKTFGPFAIQFSDHEHAMMTAKDLDSDGNTVH